MTLKKTNKRINNLQNKITTEFPHPHQIPHLPVPHDHQFYEKHFGGLSCVSCACFHYLTQEWKHAGPDIGEKRKGKHVSALSETSIISPIERDKISLPFSTFYGRHHVCENFQTDLSHFHLDHPQHFDASSFVSCYFHYQIWFHLRQQFQRLFLPSCCAPFLFHVPSLFPFYALPSSFLFPLSLFPFLPAEHKNHKLSAGISKFIHFENLQVPDGWLRFKHVHKSWFEYHFTDTKSMVLFRAANSKNNI